jgi:hypothetical protein
MNWNRYNKAVAGALVPVAIVVSAYLSTGHLNQDQVVAALIGVAGVVAIFLAPRNADPEPATPMK